MTTKVLYGLWNYPQLSETYVETEIEYALSQGIEVRVWSGVARKGDVVPRVPVYRGTLLTAMELFKPDVFHIHYLAAAPGFLAEAGNLSVPVTIRGHSFDWDPLAATTLAQHRLVRKIWLFPHFAAQIPPHQKISGLPVACSSKLYVPTKDKSRRLVFRAAAGRPDKGLDDFFKAAQLCPEFTFILCVAEAGGPGGGPELIEKLSRQAKESNGRVGLLVDVAPREVAAIMRQAGIYLDTSDPEGHPFGMPISIAEAFATGAFTLCRMRPGAPGFMGEAGAIYQSAEEAAGLINATLGWSDTKWENVWSSATLRGEAFKDVNVLGSVVEFWKSLSRDVA